MSTLIEVVVDGLWREGEHNLAVRLVTPDGDPLPAWQPGAHIDLHLANGVTRQYSLTGSHRRLERYLICVARSAESRGGSRYIHETLRPGQRLMISLPRNQFALQTARHVTLMAAGIGITPLYSMARALAAQGKPFTLQYYLNRRENGALVAAIARKLAPENVRIYSSAEGESPRENLAGRLRAPHREERIYVCGPAGFMAAVRQAAAIQGWQAEQIHEEAFQASMPANDVRQEETFTVTLASSGQCWPVAANQTIAQVLQENGVAVPLSCEMGICGACLTRVVEGEVDHRDTVQSAAEKCAIVQHVALCCSRSRSTNLLIDL